MSDYHKRIMNFNKVREYLMNEMDYNKEYNSEYSKVFQTVLIKIM